MVAETPAQQAAPIDGPAYRPDLDGLRAVAVLAVVLYHLNAPGTFGGFVGVDVFFVISGYLITGIIARDIAQGRFTIREFYRRRILRILPALLAMLLASTIVAGYFMLPQELSSFARSVLATVLFTSNLLYAHAGGYFTPDAQTNALLHTWSLAVEEQFYLLWPLLLLLTRTRAQAVAVATAIAIASFLTAMLLLPRDPSGTFYYLHTRAWELMVGALVALRPPGLLRLRPLREVAAALGLLLILFAVKRYNQAVPFPGPAALVPVGGAALLIAAGARGHTMTGGLLSIAPVRAIGRISYSLYLWHWPVFFFSQTALFVEQSASARAVELAVALLLAAASWRFIESPFRGGALRLPVRPAMVSASAAIAIMVVASALTVQAAGFPGRLTPEENRIAAFTAYAGDRVYRGGQCFVVDPRRDRFDDRTCLSRGARTRSVLIVGDSHAAQLYPGLSVDPSIAVLQATATGCRPVLAAPSAGEPYCQTLFRWVLQEWLPHHPTDVVVLAGRWSPSDLAQLPATIASLRPYTSHVLVVGPVPQYVSSLPRLLVLAQRRHDPDLLRRGLLAAERTLDAQLGAVATGAGAGYFSMIQGLCPQGPCRTFADGGVPLQFDYGHFTREGSEVAVSPLLQWLRANVWSAAASAARPAGGRQT